MKKKIVLGTMFILMLAGLLNIVCGTTNEVNAHDSQTVIFFSDFDDGTLQGWRTRDNSNVSSERSHSGSYSLKLQDDKTGGGEAECYKIFEPITEGIAEFWMYVPSGNNDEVVVYLSDQNSWNEYPNERFRIEFRSDGSVRYYVGEYRYFTVRTPISLNAWNKIMLTWNSTWDMDTAYLHLTINDVYYGRGLLYQFGGAIRQLVFEGGCKGCTETYAWFDDVKVSEKEKNRVACWRMDEGSGDTAIDSSGNNNHGTAYGVKWVKGISGTALDFDKIEHGYVVVSDNPVLDITGDFSITAWVKPHSHSGNSDTQLSILSKHMPDVNNDGSWRWALQNDKLSFVSYHGTNDQSIQSISEIPLNTWSFIVTIFDTETQTVIICIDGQQDYAEYHEFFIADTNASLYIGSENGKKNWFDGLIDEVCIYDYALSYSEIQQQYSAYAIPEEDGDNGKTPGFDLAVFIGAAAIALMVNRKRKANN